MVPLRMRRQSAAGPNASKCAASDPERFRDPSRPLARDDFEVRPIGAHVGATVSRDVPPCRACCCGQLVEEYDAEKRRAQGDFYKTLDRTDPGFLCRVIESGGLFCRPRPCLGSALGIRSRLEGQSADWCGEDSLAS